MYKEKKPPAKAPPPPLVGWMAGPVYSKRQCMCSQHLLTLIRPKKIVQTSQRKKIFNVTKPST